MNKNDERKALKDDELESASGGVAKSKFEEWVPVWEREYKYDPKTANKAFNLHGEEISPAHRLHMNEFKKK